MTAKAFPCKSCGARLEFSPGAQTLKCTYCGFENVIPQKKEDIQELDFHEFLDKATQAEDVIESQTVKCNSCGAQSTLDPKISMSHCPFCGMQLQAQAQTNRVIKPKSLLPFKVTAKEGMDKFRVWLGGLWFAPSTLKQFAAAEGALKGMYIPYWTYDSYTTTWYEGEQGVDYEDVEVYTERDDEGNEVQKERVIVRTEWYPVSGTVWRDFDDVMVLASWSLPREKTERLEPWDLENLVPYSDEFLSGFQSEIYSVDLKAGFEQAKKKMEAVITDDVRADIGGDHQRIHNLDTQYDRLTFKHVLLPIWINAYRYANKSYRFVVNGRSGQVQGERPWSYAKIALTIGGVIAAGVVIWSLVRYVF